MRLRYQTIKIDSSGLSRSQNNRMIGGKLPDRILRDTPLFIQRVQILNSPVMKHLDKFHENICRTCRIIHCPVMIVKRHSYCFCHRIQFKTVQSRQQKTSHRHGVNYRELPCNPLQFTILLDETHIESCIMCNHDRPFTEFHKLRKHRPNHRRIHHHTVIDSRQIFNLKRNRHLRIHKSGKTLRNLAIFHTHSADFDDLIHNRRKSGSLQVKDHKGLLQGLFLTVDHNSLQIIHQICFHSVDDLERCRYLF